MGRTYNYKKEVVHTEETCSHCNGSGEGYIDGSTCPVCKGYGVSIEVIDHYEEGDEGDEEET